MKNRLNLLYSVLFAFIAVRFTVQNWQYLWLSMADETSYLRFGLKLPLQGVPEASWAPLYAVWYYLLSLFRAVPLDLYYLSAAVIAALLPIVLYLLLTSLEISLTVSLTIAFLFLTSMFNFPIFPKVSNLAFIIIALALIAAGRLPSKLSAFSVLALAALLAMYLRPEYSLALGIFLALGLLLSFNKVRNKQRPARQESAILTVLLLSGILCAVFFGLPQGERSYTAFGQHLLVNHAVWVRAEKFHPRDWEAVSRRYFGRATSIGQALRANPGIVLRHVASNMISAPKRTAGSFIHSSLLFPDRYQGLVHRLNVLLLLGVLGYALLGRKSWLGLAEENWRDCQAVVIGTLVFALPPLISCLIIFPRYHYLVLLVLPLTVVAALFLTRRTIGRRLDTAVAGILLIILVIAAPAISTQSDYGKRALANRRGITTLIGSLDSLAGGRGANLLSNGQYYYYLGPNFTPINVESKGATAFPAFVRARSIGFIVIDNAIKTIQAYKNDPGFQRFIRQPELFGFKRLPIGNSRDYILYDQTFLKPRK